MECADKVPRSLSGFRCVNIAQRLTNRALICTQLLRYLQFDQSVTLTQTPVEYPVHEGLFYLVSGGLSSKLFLTTINFNSTFR